MTVCAGMSWVYCPGEAAEFIATIHRDSALRVDLLDTAET